MSPFRRAYELIDADELSRHFNRDSRFQRQNKQNQRRPHYDLALLGSIWPRLLLLPLLLQLQLRNTDRSAAVDPPARACRAYRQTAPQLHGRRLTEIDGDDDDCRCTARFPDSLVGGRICNLTLFWPKFSSTTHPSIRLFVVGLTDWILVQVW